MKLSIGQAWDEARGVIARDGSGLLAIGLAMMVLPNAILETVAPSSLRTDDAPWWLSILGLVSALIGLAGQVAVSRIALGPPTTVGGAIAIGFRRLPTLFGALLMVAVPFILMASALLLSQGMDVDPQKLPPALALPLLAIMLAGLFVLVRLLFLTPLAADRVEGPVALIREAWGLSRGRWGRLFLLILLLMIVALVLLGGLAGAISAVIILSLGAIEPGNVSAVLVALVQSLIGATVSVFFVVVVSRLYAQARGDAVAVSVPSAGGD